MLQRVTCWWDQPSAAAPRGPLPQTAHSCRLHPHPTSQLPPRSGITDSTVCTGRKYPNLFGMLVFQIFGLGFRSTLEQTAPGWPKEDFWEFATVDLKNCETHFMAHICARAREYRTPCPLLHVFARARARKHLYHTAQSQFSFPVFSRARLA